MPLVPAPDPDIPAGEPTPEEAALASTEPELHGFQTAYRGMVLTAEDLLRARDAGGDAAEDAAHTRSARRPTLHGDTLWRIVMGDQPRSKYEAGAVAMIRQAWEQGYDSY